MLKHQRWTAESLRGPLYAGEAFPLRPRGQPAPIYPTLKAYGTSGPTIGAAAVSKMLAAPKGGREGDPLTN